MSSPILTSQSENLYDLGYNGDDPDEPDPNPHQDFDFYPQMEEKLPKQVKSDLFVLHMKKVTHEDGSTVVICNYCKKVFKWHKSGGYRSYRKHITNSHPDAQAKSSLQSQIPRTTLTEALENIYEKEKKMLEKILEKYNGRVSVCADIWSDHWQMHSYIGVTCHYMDNAWTIQKRILAFRVFDEKHIAANIFRHLRIIFTEYKIENKIFAIGFDNASNNTAVIPALIELCKPYLGVFYTGTNNLSGVYYPTTNLFIIESLNIAGAFAHCESDSELHESITAMKDKWLEYYKEFPNIYLIALCFDPRCRLESLPDYLSAYYEQGLKIDYDVDMCCARVKTLLYELYDEYIKVYGPSLNIDVPQTQNVSRSSSSSSSGFVNLGFIEDTEDKKFDILHWWKEHERYFPILAMIAKQILSTPVSTVAVEQQFSAGGNILDPKRSLMSPKSLQIQACVEDWTKAQYRQ
ncbi:hypothetical protein Dsin_012101 [Dipteronia sinensis]|uniref:BED-type domain-containing protein n=1 Tax=Dipteronia sinensis TaxID=43782 RepID=A0AAE0AHM9_9ROSI|nr:hypothetical protein Dsin_012101 [Dipteronia sinensis]